MELFYIIGAILCGIAVLLGVVAAIMRTYPDDFAIIGMGVVELYLVVYGIAAGVHLANGDVIQGEFWEFWGYLLTALFIAPLAFWWALADKTRWSNIIMAAASGTVFVMLFRMNQIWYG
ncbi:hypothetical protein [Neomicrococcus aestuarii]|uniref:Uncharacterized protein n=1 Tax=Neomicrococcus aestuarii TaxID=556325 RepID=A0A1L2ZLR3_9MICC|nr:hypothetical protein [Neomicrococcus aestuarii]APF40333.1 hypothetical protein BHE16_04110 [Neomicrococcus aestuarii]